MSDPTSPIRDLRLEMLRPGPSHNQLLSPLTPYIALCGADGPVTINIPYEHRQLLTRLKRLRYEIDGKEIAREQREAEIREIGETIGKVLGSIPAFFTELGNALCESGCLVHLRLCISGAELGLLPFEAAIAPDGLPGSGSPLFLSSGTPIILTREVRRTRPLNVQWNRPPRILFAFASPEGYALVPAQDHLEALRGAIEPWVAIHTRAENRLDDVKKILTVLPNATLKDIGKACAQNEYTHVHILAHGDAFESAGEQRFGLVLESHQGQSHEIVDGEQLAIAIMGRDSSGRARPCPVLVSLSNCDSGNSGSVLAPGSSIAHDLYVQGIPWVIASQFPLWMRASTIATQVLFDALMRGDDPRWALCELRQRLRADAPATHDWASIVAYATVPADFDAQVDTFRTRQTKARTEVLFKRIDALLARNDSIPGEARAKAFDPDVISEIDIRCEAIRMQLEKWRSERLAYLPELQANREKSERLGVSGASEKRIGIALDIAAAVEEKRKFAYKQSAAFYREAVEVDPNNHWAITQFLSICAIQQGNDKALDALKPYRTWWLAARGLAEMQKETTEGRDRAWALSTLAELELLGTVYDALAFRQTRARKSIESSCKALLECVEPGDFAIESTQRQFKRYVDYWSANRSDWKELAQAALDALRVVSA